MAHVAAHELADDDATEPTGAGPVELLTVGDADREHEARAHLVAGDEARLPEGALDGPERAHRLDRAAEPPVDLGHVVGRLAVVRDGHGEHVDTRSQGGSETTFKRISAVLLLGGTGRRGWSGSLDGSLSGTAAQSVRQRTPPSGGAVVASEARATRSPRSRS